MKRFWKKALAAALSGALAVSCTLPAFAAGPQSSEMTKNENVFVILNPDGSIREQIVSDWLHSDSGFSAAADRSSLTGITNLTDTVMPEQNGQELTWTTDAKDIYYQGTTDQTPPVTVEIRYTLDGSPVTAEELEGKSGHLVIRLALTNHEGQQKKIGGKTRTVYTPFFTVAALTLPVGTYTDVTALHGTVQTDAKTQLACFLAMPGMSETLDGLLPGAFSGLENYLLDELVVEADVTDCTLPTVLLASSTSVEELSDGLDLPDLDLSQLDQLKDAAAQLQSGASTLHQATGALQSKMEEFESSYATFDAGVDSALSGAQQVQAGSQRLLDGTKSLDDGAIQLADGTVQLDDGARQLSDKLQQQLVPALQGAAGQQAALEQEMEALLEQLEGLKFPDVAALKTQLATGVGQVFDGAAQGAAQAAAQNVGDAVKSGAAQAAQAAVGQAMPAVSQAVQDTLTAALQPYVDSGKLSPEEAAAIQEQAGGAVQAAAPAVQEAAAGAIQSQVNFDAAQVADQVVAGMATQKQAAVDKVTAALDGLDVSAVEPAITGFLKLAGDAQTMMNSLKTLTGALYDAETPANPQTVAGAAAALASGTAGVRQGVSTLRTGADQLTAGAAELNNGASALSAGLSTLSASSKTVKDAIGQFRTGAGSLNEGAGQLQAGLDTCVEQVGGRLKYLAGSADGGSLGQVLDAMEEQAAAYTSYTGSAEGVKASVKFIMKTDEPDTPQTESPAAAQQPEPAVQETTFWDRVLHLFG